MQNSSLAFTRDPRFYHFMYKNNIATTNAFSTKRKIGKRQKRSTTIERPFFGFSSLL
jgi:hypothetical protein